MPRLQAPVTPVPTPRPVPETKPPTTNTLVEALSPQTNNSLAKPDQVQVSVQGSAAATLSLDPEPQFISHTVKRGETLSDIARKYLGNPNKHLEIYNANRDDLRNPNDLRIGMTLKIPVPAGTQQPVQPPKPAEETSSTQPAPPQGFSQYTVGRGDTLSSIALDTLGDSERYMEIYNANRDILKDPDALRKGMVLKIPQRTPQSGKPNPTPTTPTTDATTGTVDASGLTPVAQELLGAMQRYQEHHARLGNTGRTKTTQAQMIEIARELDAASKAFKVDPKMMLALYAHESGGINPGARSHTGAGGLGQLTSIAIRQVHFMAGIGKGNRGTAPFTQYKSNFIQNSRSIKERYNIKANIWTTVAYMNYELNDRAKRGDGVKQALKRYGDPYVPTYADKVNAEYKTLFGGKLF